jgi:Transposase DDE domain
LEIFDLKKKAALEAAIAQQQSVIVRQLGRTWAEQLSFYRFLHHPAVTLEALLAAHVQQSGLDTYAGHVLALTDTTELDLTSRRQGLDPATVGPIGDGRGVGLLVHPVLCLSATPTPQVLGVSSLQCWHRPLGGYAAARGHGHKQQPLAEKESHKWALAGQQTRQALPAARLTLVADRESDNYATLAQWQALGLDFVVRCRADRRLVSSSDKLFTHLAQQPAQAHWEQVVARQKATVGEPTRQAQLTLRFMPLTLQRPVTAPGQVAQLACWAVSVTEDAPPPGEKPIAWRLLTSHPLPDVATAQQVVSWYAQRWWIEQLFRVLKQQGLRLEDTQLRDGAAITRLLVVALPTAVQVMQLVRARQQPDPAPPSVLPAAARELARHWVRQLEGNTAKQRNPHPPDSLAWVAWLYARLGGWNGLPSERPPGVITLCRGATRFHQFFDDWQTLAPLMYKP